MFKKQPNNTSWDFLSAGVAGLYMYLKLETASLLIEILDCLAPT